MAKVSPVSSPYVARPVIESRIHGPLETCAAEGIGAVIVVRGEAGIGKSTMVARSVDHATSLGLDVWTAEAQPVAHNAPLSLFTSLRSAGGGALLDDRLLFPVPVGDGATPVSAGVERLRAAEQLATVIESRAQEPMLVVLDDVHWADPPSVEAIAALAEVALTHPLVVVLTLRSGHRREDLDQLLSDLSSLGASEIDVPPLTVAEVDALLPALCGGQPSAGLVERASGAAGNPFLLTALATGLLEEGALIARDDEVDADSVTIPAALRVAVDRQLRRLDSGVGELLRAAAVHGPVLDIDALAEVLRTTPLAMNDSIALAEEAGLLETRSAQMRFRHELVRDAIYRSMPPAVRSAVHRQLASILVARSAPAAVIGSHLVLGGAEEGDAEALEYLRRAAVETAPVDPDSALEFLDRARLLAAGDVAALQIIERARVDALTSAGRLDDAETVARWLLDVADNQDLVSSMRMRLAALASLKGLPLIALEHLDAAKAVAGNDLRRARIVSAQATAAMLASDFVAAATFADEAQRLGESIGDPVGQSVGLGVSARLATYDNDLVAGTRLGAKAAAIADTDPSGLAHEHLPCLYYGITALNADDLDLVASLAARGLELADQHRLAWSRPLFDSLAAVGHWHRGVLDEAHAIAESVVATSEQTRSVQALLWAESVLTLVTLETEGIESAQAWGARVEVSLRRRSSQLGMVYAVMAQARVRAAAGDPQKALDGLHPVWEFLGSRGSGTRRPFLAWDQFVLARLVGNEALIETTITSTRESARITRAPRIGAMAGFMDAVVSNDRGAAAAALAELKSLGRPLDVAVWLEEGADTLTPEQPADALHEALDRYQELGAMGSADRVRARLVAIGQRAATMQAVVGWESLTPTETDIARLLAQGLTNAEIAQRRGGSRRTVEAHLRRIYHKMQIDGRVKLTVAAADHFGPSAGTADRP